MKLLYFIVCLRLLIRDNINKFVQETRTNARMQHTSQTLEVKWL